MADATQAKDDILKSVGAKRRLPKKPKDSADVVRSTPAPSPSTSGPDPSSYDLTPLEPVAKLVANMLTKMGLGPKDAAATAADIGKNLEGPARAKLESVAEDQGFDASPPERGPEGDGIEPAEPVVEDKGTTRVFKTPEAPVAVAKPAMRPGFEPVTAADNEPNKVRSVPVQGPVPEANDTKPFSFTGKGVPTSPIIDERTVPSAPQTRKFQDRVPPTADEPVPGWVDSILNPLTESIMNPRTTSDGMGGPGPGMTAKDIMDWKARGFTTEPYRAPAQENRYGGREYRAQGQQALTDAEARLEEQLAAAPTPPVTKPVATAAGAAKDMAAGTPPNLGPTSWMDDFVRFASVQPDVAPASPTAPASAPAARSAPAPAPAPAVVPKEALSPVEQRMAVAQITPRLTTTDPRAPIHGGSMASEILQGPFGTAPTVGAFDKTVGPADAPQTKRTELGYELGQRIGSTIFDPGKAEGAPTVNAAEPIRMDPSQGAPIGSLPPIRPGATPPPEAQNVRQGINPLNNSPFTTYSMGGWDVTSFGDGSAIRSTPGVEGYTQSWNPQTSSWSGSPQMGGAALPNTAPSKPSPQVFSGPNSNPTPNWSDPHP